MGIPHLNQTAYRHGVSIHDASFAIQETIRKYVCEGDIVYQVFYDLEKAFDSVEFRHPESCPQVWNQRESLESHEIIL